MSRLVQRAADNWAPSFQEASINCHLEISIACGVQTDDQKSGQEEHKELDSFSDKSLDGEPLGNYNHQELAGLKQDQIDEESMLEKSRLSAIQLTNRSRRRRGRVSGF